MAEKKSLMYEGYEYIIDPEEDEVFFTNLATESQLKIFDNPRKSLSPQKLCFENEENERQSLNLKGYPPEKNVPIKEKSLKNSVGKAFIAELNSSDWNKSLLNEKAEECVELSSPIVNVMAICNASAGSLTLDRSSGKKNNCAMEEANVRNETRLIKNSAKGDGGVDTPRDIDFTDCEMDDSLTMWVSMDVEKQINNLTSGLDLQFSDDNGDESSSEDEFKTARGTPRSAQSRCEDVNTFVTTLTSTPLPAKGANIPEPAGVESHSEDTSLIETAQYSGSCASIVDLPFEKLTSAQTQSKDENTFVTTITSTLLAAQGANIQAEPALFRKPAATLSPKVSRIPLKSSRTEIRRASTSRIPSVPGKTCVSLKVPEMQNPIATYIHQKTTPLIRNITKNTPSKNLHTPRNAAPRKIPQSVSRIGVPHSQHVAPDSRLPKMGPSQWQEFNIKSPRVITHKAREHDVSVLEAAEVTH